VIPVPFTPADRAAGYWWELSLRQVEVSRTLVFDAPRQARAFFEALIADNLDLGRPENVEVLFKRDPRGRKPKDQGAGGAFKTAIDRRCDGVTINAFWRHSRVKQYLKDGRALRIETVVNSPDDLGCQRRICNLPSCRPGRVRSTPACCTLKKSARDASSIVRPLRGYRCLPSPGTAGGPQDYGSATPERKPGPAPWPTCCAPSPAPPTRACAP